MALATIDGYMALEYAKELRRDREILLTAFRQDPAYETLDHYADDALKGDREFIPALRPRIYTGIDNNIWIYGIGICF